MSKNPRKQFQHVMFWCSTCHTPLRDSQLYFMRGLNKTQTWWTHRNARRQGWSAFPSPLEGPTLNEVCSCFRHHNYDNCELAMHLFFVLSHFFIGVDVGEMRPCLAGKDALIRSDQSLRNPFSNNSFVSGGPHKLTDFTAATRTSRLQHVRHTEGAPHCAIDHQ